MSKQQVQSGNAGKKKRLGVVAIFAVALGIRLVNLNATSLWIDEIYSFIVANGHLPPTHLSAIPQSAADYYQHYLAWQPLRLPDLVAALKINVHLPLYYLLLNPWLGWLGNTAWALRSFSALCSALMVFPLYALGNALAGRRAGLFTALMAALLPFQIYYGQEGRMYALSLLCASLASLAFWKTLYARRPVGWSILYALSLTAGASSHYMFVFFLGFQGAYTLLWLVHCLLRQRHSAKEATGPMALGDKHGSDSLKPPITDTTSSGAQAGRSQAERQDAASRTFQPWRMGLFIVALLCIGSVVAWWFPVYLAQQNGVNEEYHFAKRLVGGLRYPTVFVWNPLIVVAGANRLERIFYIPLTVLLSALCFWPRRKNSITTAPTIDPAESAEGMPSRHWFQRDGFLWMWVFVPLALQVGYDLIKHTHISVIDRYALLISPALCLILGLGLARLSQWEHPNHRKHFGWTLTQGVLAMMVVLGIAAVLKPSPFRDEHNKDKDIRGKIHYMARQAKPGDLLFANGPFGAPNILAYYLVKEPAARTTVDSARMPIMYWISEHYGTHPDFPPDALFQSYQRVWFFRYRANNERGLQICKDRLQALFPHMAEIRDWFIYTLN